MKKIFKAIAVLSATALVAVSCNVEAVSTEFDPSTVEAENSVSFVQSVVVDQEIPATTASYSIPMARSIATEALTVSLTSTLPAAIECPASITFAAGEYETNLILNISNMSVGETFKGKISVNLDDAAKNVAFSNYEVSCTLAKAFTWESIGKGQFFDNFWVGELFNDVEVLKAEGFEIYRFMDPYKDTEEGEGAKPEYVLLTVNSDKTAKFETFNTPYMYNASACVTAYFPSDASSKAAEYDAYNVFVDDYYFALVPYWYVNGVGGWGCNYGHTLFAALPGAPTDIYEWYLASPYAE